MTQHAAIRWQTLVHALRVRPMSKLLGGTVRNCIMFCVTTSEMTADIRYRQSKHACNGG